MENNSSRIANKDVTTVVNIKTLLLFINQAHCCFNQLRKANLQKLVTVAGIEIEVMLFSCKTFIFDQITMTIIQYSTTCKMQIMDIFHNIFVGHIS